MSRVRLWFDKPALNEPFILREPQDEREVEGMIGHGESRIARDRTIALSESKGEQGIATQGLRIEGANRKGVEDGDRAAEERNPFEIEADRRSNPGASENGG
jgi:hypothetical protein